MSTFAPTPPLLRPSHKPRRTKAKALQDTLGSRVQRILSADTASSSQQQQQQQQQRVRVVRPTTPSPFTTTIVDDRSETSAMYGLSPQALQRDIRLCLLRVVLSTEAALRPNVALHRLRSSLEPALGEKCAWVNYCISVYLQQRRRSRRHGGGACEADAAPETRTVSDDCNTNNNEAEEAAMCGVGKAYCALYRRGIVQLLVAHNKTNNNNITSDDDDNGAARRPRSPHVVTDVLAWMAHTILLCDPSFRISYYGQHVCYPCLPSLLLATYNVAHHGEPYARYAQLVQASQTSKDGDAQGQWTVLHSLFYLFDGFVESSLSHLVKEARGVQQAIGDELQAVDTTSSKATGDDTNNRASSACAATESPLLQHWLRCWDEVSNNEDDTHGCTATAAVDQQQQQPQLSGSAAGFNEAKTGGVSLRKLVDELTIGAAASLTRTLARRRASGNALYLVQARILRPLFSYVVCSPIALTRLAMLLRWHVSLPVASAFPSLLYFLLVFAGNPTMRRMGERDRERRQSRARLGSFLAGLAHPNLARLQRQVASRSTPVYRSQMHTDTTSNKAVVGNCTNGADEDDEAKERRAVFAVQAAHMAAAAATSAGSVEVARLIFFRILPSHRRRPGQAAVSQATEGGASKNKSRSASPYTCIEVLDTDKCTPKEVLAHLQRSVERDHTWRTAAAATSSSSSWEAHDATPSWLRAEEEYILCYPVSRVVLGQRMHAVARAWVMQHKGPHKQQQEEQEEEGEGGEAEGTTLTLGQLCRLCLWEHEYGQAMACEMMWAYLSLFPDLVHLSQAAAPLAARSVTFLRSAS